MYASDFVYDALKILFIKASVDKKTNKEQSEYFIRCIENIRIDAKNYYQNEINNKEEYAHKLEEMAEVLNGRKN